MRKCLVTQAIGEKHQRIEAASRAFRLRYSERHGYDHIVIESFDQLQDTGVDPDDFLKGRGGRKPLAMPLLKFYFPRALQGYDFAVFMDADGFVHPKAPCLTQHAEQIPPGGFGAVQTVPHDRIWKHFPLWGGDYFINLEHRGLALDWIDRTRYINGGMLVLRPNEVKDSWPDLIGRGENLHEENLLNAFGVQAGLCHLLPKSWNVLWYYKKVEMGWLRPENSWFAHQLNRVKNRAALGERWLVNKIFDGCHFLHFAFEHKKMRLLDQERWLSQQ